MDQYNFQNDSRGQGLPPPYSHNDLPLVMRPTNVRVKTGETIPPMQPPHDAMGQPIPIQHGTILQPRTNDPMINPAIIPVIVGHQMGPQPATMTCPTCRQAIVTRLEAKATMKTHIFAIMFGMVCLWPCVAAVYCLKSCRNTDHYCPNCSAYIGSYVR